jgi:hypothetical protein
MQKRQTFLLIGQSNMAGRGELNRVPPIVDDRIQMFRNGCWQNAVEPLHDDRPDLAGVGLAMSFADELLKSEPDQIIGLIPCAVGFTKIEQWLPGTALYQRAFNAALESGERLNGILWHQGESDSDDEARAKRYREHFIELVQTLQRDLDMPCLPVISGELGDFINAGIGYPFSRQVSVVVHDLTATLPNYAFVSAEGLSATSDGLHFNAPSLREFGRRYARAYMQLISNRTT